MGSGRPFLHSKVESRTGSHSMAFVQALDSPATLVSLFVRITNSPRRVGEGA
jgi:hypothetical protein